jgi:Ca-activated chloride channel family protein
MLRTRTISCSLWLTLSGLLLLAAPAKAQGLLIPTERQVAPLGLKSHRVDIQVDAGIAVATIEQVWRNDGARPLEATYFFPVPKGAAVVGFELEINGKMQKGELLEKEKAARIYQEIVSRMVDPGLVEWMDKDLFQVRIFPVPARGTQRLKLKYTQPLEWLGTTYRMVYPLRSSRQSLTTLEDFTLTARVRHPVPISTAMSPSHKISVAHRGGETIIGFEGERVPLDKDFVLFLGPSSADIGVHVLTHKKAGENGFFIMTAAPRDQLETSEIQGKNITFVLDTSGSMTGEKMEQAKRALIYCVDRLGHDDRFDIIRFSSDVERLSSSGLIAASDSNKERARRFIGEFEAAGGTAIDEALSAAVASTESQLVLFVTDGRPTVGEVNTETILKSVEGRNAARRSRVFALGVGEDLNTHLVDSLAEHNGGTSHYVRPGEDVKVAIAALYEQIAYPVLSDLKLVVDPVSGDPKAYALLPNNLPNLFRGQQLMVAGRYRGSGKARFRLEGKVGNETRRFELEVAMPDKDTDLDHVASVWAHRQVGQLLDQVRLHGETPDLKNEIIQLAKQYGIVTPYTSWLVVDDSELTQGRPDPRPLDVPRPPRQPRPPFPSPWQEGARNTPTGDGVGGRGAAAPKLERPAEERERIVLDAASAAEPSAGASFREDRGKAGVDAAETVRILKHKKDNDSLVRSVKRVGARVFTFDGQTWRDQAITTGLKRVAIKAFSSEWMELAKKDKDVRAALALGERVELRLGDTIYVVTP